MEPYRIDPFSAEVDFSPASIWANAQRDYLSGETAPRVCERYEIPLSTFRERAKREGWRRCDMEPDLAEPRPLDPAPPTGEMVELARRAMADALRRGRPYEARSFMGLMRDLREEARQERREAEHAARLAAEAADTETSVAELDSPDSESASLDGADVLATLDAALAALATRHDGLKALARSGQATPKDLLALRDAQTQLRQTAAQRRMAAQVVRSFAEIDTLMADDP